MLQRRNQPDLTGGRKEQQTLLCLQVDSEYMLNGRQLQLGQNMLWRKRLEVHFWPLDSEMPMNRDVLYT